MKKKESTKQPPQREQSARRRDPQSIPWGRDIYTPPNPPSSQSPRIIPRVPSLFTPLTPEERRWRDYWEAQGQPWRTEPEIDAQRQAELAKRRASVPDVENVMRYPFSDGAGSIDGARVFGVPDDEKGRYPFSGMKLNRADVEWLLATHENGRGPVDWRDVSQRKRVGLDLRGADLRGSGDQRVDLAGLPLTRLVGGLPFDGRLPASEEQKGPASVLLTGANLRGARLEGAILYGAQLEGANLHGAQLERANLGEAQLRGANLGKSQLLGADLRRARLENADLSWAKLQRADLRLAWLDGAIFNDVLLADNDHPGPCLADVQWGSTNLTVIDWSQLASLGDEREARKNFWFDETENRIYEYKAAVRAYRQLSVVLQGQGLNEDASRFAYRAQVMQKGVYLLQVFQFDTSLRQGARALGSWLFSWFLFLLAGYGYKPLRSFLAYLLVITGFATAYYLLGLHDLVGPHHLPGPHYLSWYEAIVVSMTAFHGRGFFTGTFSPGDPQAMVAAFEAFLGLLIEVTFIATLTQRLFSR